MDHERDAGLRGLLLPDWAAVNADRRHERGLTLTELTIVGVLAAIVMTGLIGIYFNSQSLWLDGSSQAITQREATLALRAISKQARRAKSALASPGPQSVLTLTLPPPDSTWSYWVQDGLLYEGQPGAGHSMISSAVEGFWVRDSLGLVIVDALQLRSAEGQHITVSTSVAKMNWAAP